MEPRESGTHKECSICMEVISETQNPPRRFGIMESCDHVFCLDCIRKWRSNINVQTFRTCPCCRTYTEFVAPSSSWVESSIEKVQLFLKRKETLRKFKAIFFALGYLFQEREEVSVANISLGDFGNVTLENLFYIYSKKYDVVPPTADTFISVMFELGDVYIGPDTVFTGEPLLDRLLEVKIITQQLLIINQIEADCAETHENLGMAELTD